MKKLIMTSILALSLALPVNPAFADTTNQEVEVTGGSLQVNQTQPSFAELTLQIKKMQQSKATNEVFINDSRGNGAGWNVTLAATDFSLVKEIQGSTTSFTIPASAVQVTSLAKKTVTGVPVNYDSGDSKLVHNQPLSSTPVKVVVTGVGEGQGAYLIALEYILSLPKTLQSSEGKEVGVLAGMYSSTFTFSATSGI